MVIAGENNIGSLAENAVYLRLKEQGDVRYLLEKEGEIDFLVKGNAVEVKYWDKVESEQIQSLSHYKGRKVKAKFVITKRAGTNLGSVKQIPLWRFLSRDGAF